MSEQSDTEEAARRRALQIAADKLAWLVRQCRSPRPRLGTLTLAAMADLAQAVNAENVLTSPESMELGVPMVEMDRARTAVVEAVGRVIGSIGGGA